MSLTAATHGDALRVFPSVFIIAQSDTISRLQKISMEQLLFNLSKILFLSLSLYKSIYISGIYEAASECYLINSCKKCLLEKLADGIFVPYLQYC